MDNEDLENVEVSDELQDDESAQEENVSVVQTIADFNVNYTTGTLGIIGSLGFVFGAILGTAYDRIFRK